MNHPPIPPDCPYFETDGEVPFFIHIEGKRISLDGLKLYKDDHQFLVDAAASLAAEYWKRAAEEKFNGNIRTPFYGPINDPELGSALEHEGWEHIEAWREWGKE